MGSLPYVVEDLNGFVQIFSDGSIDYKDYCYDKLHDLHLRLYKPKSTRAGTKLSVMYFLHGGGFCGGSFAWPNFHNCCLRISSALHAIVVAPDYRLAPEHRLPAAIDDSFGALKWLQEIARNPKNDVVDCFDFDKFFIIGDSSGGNIAHHLAVWLGPGSPELAPIKIRGYVMLAPFFGGKERTKSEAQGQPEKMLNIDLLDTLWRMSLPVGSTPDHPFANPFGPKSASLEQIKLDPILLMVGGDEIMKDRVKLYAKRLKELGKIARCFEFKGKQHGFYTNEPHSDASDSVLNLIKDFMFKHSG
ncbi:probable carboxylesterase 15 [Tanacetum coccineum]